MAIRIVPHAPERTAAVEDFNSRMRAGGSHWGFFPDPRPSWMPPAPGERVWREYHLAVEDDGVVRGGYALKPQPWWVRGREHIVTDWQGPFSEAAVDPKFAVLGLRMMRDMLQKQPLLYSWGHGGNEQPLVQMLERMGWLMHPTPFCLRILRPFAFLRRNRQLRDRRVLRWLCDAAAFTGAGYVGLRALHWWRRRMDAGLARAEGRVVERFESWADELWERCRDRYLAIAERTAAAMNRLAPVGEWPPVERLRVEIDGHVIGWALLMDTHMQDDPRFGTLRVGSIVDCLAIPEHAPGVVAAATRRLRQRGVDIIVSNQAHPAWAAAFAQDGYLVLPDKRLFAGSPQLQAVLEPFEETAAGLHLTNMDGHGPMAL